MTRQSRWHREALAVAIIYFAIGIVTARLAGAATTLPMRSVWRMTGWVLSLVTFIGHISYGMIRVRSTVKSTAVHAAFAVALAAFALAAAGPVRHYWGTPELVRVSLLSLILWPILASVPAFFVAFGIATFLRRFGKG